MVVRGTPSSGTIRELQVSGHTMALEPGLYCVIHEPGDAAPADGSGLPGVRITTAPGRAPGVVAIAGFSPDGWLSGDDGALLRVSGATAEVLVTVYQAPDATSPAPRLQVVRLSGEVRSPPAPAPLMPAESVAAELMAHIYGLGDVAGRLGAWVGEPGSARWIEGFSILPGGDVPLGAVQYQAVLGRGWLSPWSEGGEFCGSRGMSLPILGLRVKLCGPSAETHRIQLSARFVDGTEVGPMGGDETCEAPSAAPLEAFHLVVERWAPASPADQARRR